MTENSIRPKFDLEDRTFRFAQDVVLFCKTLPHTVISMEYQKQAARAAGSVGANYIEANESLGHKDFLMRLRICRKEAKESAYWLRLLLTVNDIPADPIGTKLIAEGTSLTRIFSAVIDKIEARK